VTYTSDTTRKARIATYREGTVQCIRGPIKDALAMRDTVLKSNAAAVVRFEEFNYGTDDGYIEIKLPHNPH